MALQRSRRFSRPYYLFTTLMVLGLAMILSVSACAGNPPTGSTPTPTLTLTPTFPPTLTPTPLPLGNAENPFIIGLVSEEENPQMIAVADELARRIGTLGGTNVIGRVFPSYPALIESMANGNVHIAWLPPLTYLYASQRGIAEVALLTSHFGVYQYGTQFMANIESELTPYFDPISGLSSADAATALAQLDGLRPCWVEPESASGYILPAGLMEANNISLLPAVIARDHTAVVRALYMKGICDFGATYSISGDPRTGSVVQQDLPDVMDRILIIWRSDAVIPNYNLSFLAGLSEANRQMLTNAFLELSRTPDGNGLMSLSAGNYQIEGLKIVGDDIYNPLRDAIRVLKLDLREMVGK